MYNLIASINLDKLLAFSQCFFVFFTLKNSLQNYQNKQTKKKKERKKVQHQMKIGGSLKNVLLVASNLPCFSLQRWVSCGPPSHGLLFPRLSTADSQRLRDSQGEGIRRRREGSGQGNRGWMVVWHEDQTDYNAKKKKSTPSSTPRALHPFFSPPLLLLGGSNLHRLDLVHLCPHHLDTVEDLLLMAC